MQRSTEPICEEGQAQPRRGPSSKSRRSHEEDQAQMVTTQGLERQESKEPSPVKGEGAGYRSPATGRQLMRRRSSVEGVDTAQEAQGCQAGEAPEQYLMKKVLSGERAGAASLAML